MMKAMAEKWARNEKKLREALKQVDVSSIEYITLVALTFNIIWNEPNEMSDVCTRSIIQLGDRDYSGDLVFAIPMDSDKFEPGNFFLTYIGYGSCSGCDALYSIQSDYGEVPAEQIVNDLMTVCKDLACHAIFPFNIGWRYENRFAQTDSNLTVDWKQAVSYMNMQEYNDPLERKSAEWKEGWYAAKELMIECVNDMVNKKPNGYDEEEGDE
ncbi:MAG: hypothetical protein J6S14_15185 [Clostridia bacterium]|nr:hypothetical protein [Clostridia bacterium]